MNTWKIYLWVTYEDGIIGDKDKAENTGDDKGANYISSEDYYNMMDNIEKMEPQQMK